MHSKRHCYEGSFKQLGEGLRSHTGSLRGCLVTRPGLLGTPGLVRSSGQNKCQKPLQCSHVFHLWHRLLATGNREKTDLVNFWVQVRSLTKRALCAALMRLPPSPWSACISRAIFVVRMYRCRRLRQPIPQSDPSISRNSVQGLKATTRLDTVPRDTVLEDNCP